ncbi:HAD family hydrolase [Candidatus Woesearchaeota archaeon]|nr:HAD family hydrolase [Candidatus Woesearchaeota archaeon]
MDTLDAWIQNKDFEFEFKNIELNTKNNIALDFDGVITNPFSLKKEYLTNKGYSISKKTITKKDIISEMQNQKKLSEQQANKEYDEMIVSLYIEKMNEIPLFEYVKETINEMNSNGHNIYIVTSRYDDVQRPEIKAALEYLKENEIKIEALINTNNKSKKDVLKKIKPLIYVDDSLSKITELYEDSACSKIIPELKNTRFYLFNIHSNESTLPNNIKTVHNWKQIRDILYKHH